MRPVCKLLGLSMAYFLSYCVNSEGRTFEGHSNTIAVPAKVINGSASILCGAT